MIFACLKESKTRIHPDISVLTDTGYQGIHVQLKLPKKKTKKSPLTKDDQKNNRQLARERVLNENVIGGCALSLLLIAIEIDANDSL